MSGNSNDDMNGGFNPDFLSESDKLSFPPRTFEIRKNLTEKFEEQLETCTSVTNEVAKIEGNKPFMPKPSCSSSTHMKPPLRPKPSIDHDSNVSKNPSFSVFLRIRPPVVPPTSKDPNDKVNTIEIVPPTEEGVKVPSVVRTHLPKKSNARRSIRDSISSTSTESVAKREFQFHEILGPDKSQEDVYSSVMKPIVCDLFPSQESAQIPDIAGQSALLFAYGITNAGKTYTVLGNKKFKNKEHWGIVPRAFDDIFQRMKQYPSQPFELHLSYFEVYNDRIYDLLGKDKGTSRPFTNNALKLRERRGQTIIRGLARHRVKDVEHGLKLVGLAQSKRHTSSNNLNQGSSRSHCICQLQVVARNSHTNAIVQDDESVISASTNGYTTDEEMSKMGKEKAATIWMVDLAGSERSKRTGLTLSRQKEAAFINTSLMNLMRCLSTIRANQAFPNSTNQNIIPYRDCKLTHLFMNHLSGPFARRTCMVVNANPAAVDFDETYHVLSYACQAKDIRVDPTDYQNRLQTSNTEEYDYDGRKKSDKASSKLAAIVKKLSPKRIRKFNTGAYDRKRAASQAIRHGSSISSTSTRSESLAGRRVKRARVSKQKDSASDGHDQISKHPLSKNNMLENKSKSIEMALSIAQTENETLKKENATLNEELAQLESNIRMEVVEEMEEHIFGLKDRYQAIINDLKTQIESQTDETSATRLEQAEERIDVLLFKVEECEEEMVRMRKDHEIETESLHNQYENKLDEKDKKIATLEKEINDNKQNLKNIMIELEKSRAEIDRLGEIENRNSSVANNEELARLKAEVVASQEEIKKLKRSKQELILNYEKLLEEEDQDDDCSEDTIKKEESEILETDDENQSITDIDSARKSSIVKASKENLTPLKNSSKRIAASRAPLGLLSANKNRVAN